MKREGNITDSSLISMGFKLGAFGTTWRLDGYYENDWYYIQVEQIPEDCARLRIYASQNSEQEWELLDRKVVEDVSELRAIVSELVERPLISEESLIRPVRQLMFRLGGTNTYVVL